MTDKIPSQSACWTSLDQCLHDHHAVIAGDLRLQAAHAAFQLQLATLRAISIRAPRQGVPTPRTTPCAAISNFCSARSPPIFWPQPPQRFPARPGLPRRKAASIPSTCSSSRRIRFATCATIPRCGSGSDWRPSRCGPWLTCTTPTLWKPAVLAPSGDLDERVKVVTGEIARLIGQELDPLVRAHSVSSPRFVADYQHAKNPGPTMKWNPGQASGSG